MPHSKAFRIKLNHQDAISSLLCKHIMNQSGFRLCLWHMVKTIRY